MTGPAAAPDPDIPHGITGKVPDYPQTVLALRVWGLDRAQLTVRSLNAPQGRATWVASALASPEGGWPHDRPLVATCRRGSQHGEDDPIPATACRCGIYAARDLDVIGHYLRRDAPVLGVVELGGRVIPAEQGYRAEYARLAAILIIDPALTVDHGTLQKLASAYRVPALVPHSADPEDYRPLLSAPSLADETEHYLRRRQQGES